MIYQCGTDFARYLVGKNLHLPSVTHLVFATRYESAYREDDCLQILLEMLPNLQSCLLVYRRSFTQSMIQDMHERNIRIECLWTWSMSVLLGPTATPKRMFPDYVRELDVREHGGDAFLKELPLVRDYRLNLAHLCVHSRIPQLKTEHGQACNLAWLEYARMAPRLSPSDRFKIYISLETKAAVHVCNNNLG